MSNVLDVANLGHKILKDSLDRIYTFILTYGYSKNNGIKNSDIKVLNRLLLMLVPKSLYAQSSKTMVAPYFCKDLDLVFIDTISKHAFWAEDNEYYNSFLSAILSKYSDRSMEESSGVFFLITLHVI